VKRRIYLWVGIFGAVVIAWGVHRVNVARKNLVTLNVRNADVRDVVRKCEWQTWETIIVNHNVKGKVTLNVRKMPLEEALGIIADQTSSRASVVYPLFSKGDAFVKLRKIARGDLNRDSAGWTNFSGRGFGGGERGFRGPAMMANMADGPRAQDTPVTLNVSGKDLAFATLALSRFAQSQVIPEDGANGTINLSLSQVPFRDAVEKVAAQAKLKADVFYTLQDRPDFARDDGDRRRGPRDDNDGEDRREQWAAMRQREFEARLATMTPEEQAKAQEEQKKMEELRNLPPEQRREQFEQMANNSQVQQRMENRANNAFKYATPEQRVDRARRMAEMKARRQQQQSSR
jgi:hypothetical protein